MKNAKACRYAVLSLVAAICGFACSRPAANPAPQAAAPAAAVPAQTAPAQPAAAPAAAAPAAAAPAAAGPVLASETFSGDSNLRCDLLEVRRVSGGAVRIKWRLVNTSEKTMTTEGKSVYYNWSGWESLYYIDPAENKKYESLTDTEGKRILDVIYGHTFKAGEQMAQWAKFPAPPPSSTKITVTIPKFTPFEDVPVSQ
jgi:hypothetical protein